MDIDVAALGVDLSELVSFESVGGTSGEVEVQHWCAEKLGVLGLDVDHWQLDLPGLRQGAGYPGEEVERTEAWGTVGTRGVGTPAVVLNGHVDVVPPGDTALWTSDPHLLRESYGRWFARGTCDMLGGVAAIIAAVRTLRGTPLARPFAVHTVIGEEDGGLGTYATLRRGHLGTACVIAEPTAGAIVSANAGSLTFRIELTGHATHGSMRGSGVSVIELFAPVHRALRRLEQQRNANPPAPFGELPWPISVGMLRAGDWASTVPDSLVAEGRFGVMPGETFEEAKSAFEAALLDARHPWLDAHPVAVTWPGGHFSAGSLPAGDPFGDEVAAAVSTGAHSQPSLVGAPYGSDLRQYAQAGIPTVQYGPGDIRDAHAVDEHVEIEQVVRAAEAYARLIIARCT